MKFTIFSDLKMESETSQQTAEQIKVGFYLIKNIQ